LKTLSLIASLLVGAALIYGTLDMPDWGDPRSPANTHVSPYYLRNSLEDAATPNVVTTILADYRGYDTLGETTVIFTAGMACIFLLRRARKKERQNDSP
jgi:multicomponent Na+:H+ antiporter subunit B